MFLIRNTHLQLPPLETWYLAHRLAHRIAHHLARFMSHRLAHHLVHGLDSSRQGLICTVQRTNALSPAATPGAMHERSKRNTC
jgi:hypothetical protein